MGARTQLTVDFHRAAHCVPLAPLWEPPGHVPGELLPIDDEAPQAEPFERSGTASHSTLTLDLDSLCRAFYYYCVLLRELCLSLMLLDSVDS